MKRSLLTLTFAFFAVMACLAANSLSLIMQLKDGTKIICSLDKEPQMAFSQKAIMLSSLDGMVGQWDFTDVESWSFGNGTDDAIGDVKDVQIRIEGGEIKINNVHLVEGNSRVAVYDLTGRLRTPPIITKGCTAMISLNSLMKGTYILKVGASSSKFTIK